ncbi:MAG: PQQ-binding-like beta-propeller repeat protein [Planctomycetes bacterium]|nr:PQQ-binding-like beta-propeller repeat protein [Planctomycetota bacterium]
MTRQQACRMGLSALVTAAIAFSGRPGRADQDSIEPPWGTVHHDLAGTAASAELPYTLGEGPMEEKWRLDVVAEGHDRAGGRSSIVFDKDGNLYWISSTGGGTGGVVRLVSVDPSGKIRWAGNDGAGNVDPLASIFSGASPVVGQARVYALGDAGGLLTIAAYNKSTGENLWTADLSASTAGFNQMLTPALHGGKLYVVGLSDAKSRVVYRVDAESGDVERTSTVPEVGIAVVGQMTFVPDAFGAGLHGLYFNGDSGNGADGVPEVYGIKLEDGEASLGWASEGGKAARSHPIYSEATGYLYTLTWSDYGAQMYVFDPAAGRVGSHANSLATGHGFYDVGALEFDGTSIIAGGFDGYILRYNLAGDGTVTDEVVYKGGTTFAMPFWGETRVLGQLLRDAAGNSVLVTGTNSLLDCCASHIVALDVTNGRVLWEHGTGIVNPHQFNYAGGPILGPDGKVYYFERPAGGATALIAVGLAAAAPPPTAGFLMANAQGAEVNLTDCLFKTGDVLRLDGSCSTGKGLTYAYDADPSGGVAIDQVRPGDPAAEIVFGEPGTFTVRLEVSNAGGTASCTREICVSGTPPRCSLQVTDSAGGPIDTTDDADEVPCLPAGGTAIADASGSTGGGLGFAFTVSPSAGVSIVQAGGAADPKATIAFTDAGRYTVRVTVTNDQGSVPCQKIICVKQPPTCSLQVTDSAGGPIDAADDDDEVPCLPAGGTAIADASGSTGGGLELAFAVTPPAGVTIVQAGGPGDPKANITFADAGSYTIEATVKNDGGSAACQQTICVKQQALLDRFLRGDCNADKKNDLSDAVYGLAYLFLGGPAPSCEEACNTNGDAKLDLSDAVYELTYLFLGGPPPDAPHPDCGDDPELGPLSCATPGC